MASRTRVKALAVQTRAVKTRFFGGDIGQVPLHCLTQGRGTISDARHLILLAQGEHKAEAVYQLAEIVTSRDSAKSSSSSRPAPSSKDPEAWR